MPGQTFDNNLMFRTTGTLTANDTSSWLDIHGTGVRGMAARIVIPSATGSTPTLLVTIQDSTDGTNIANTALARAETITASGVYVLPFNTMRRYVRMLFTPASATTNPAFGTVVAGVNIDAREYDRPPTPHA